MRPQHAYFRTLAVFIATFCCILPAGMHGAFACEISEVGDTSNRQIISCGDAIQIEREPVANLRIVERANDPAPRTVEVQGGAILITVTPGSARTQVRTPHAIASVRGTTYVVDASTNQTSVFVLEGIVDVKSTNDASSVTLAPGEGVDVSDEGTLTVQIWSAERADALLARFGR